MKFIPAPLEPNLPAFTAQMDRLLPFFDQYAIDIQDGSFVSTKTSRPKDMLEYFSKKTIPSHYIFDFDLMTYAFEEDMKDIQELSRHIQIGVVIIHYGLLKGKQINNPYNFPIGISLNPQDAVSILDQQYDLKSLKAVQIMTIHAGPQGQSFMPEMLTKIGTLRNKGYENKIYLDGGINSNTIPIIKRLHELPDVLCVGSYLTKSGDDLPNRVDYLKSNELS